MVASQPTNLKLLKKQSKCKNTDSTMQEKIIKQLKVGVEESFMEGLEAGGKVRQNQWAT